MALYVTQSPKNKWHIHSKEPSFSGHSWTGAGYREAISECAGDMLIGQVRLARSREKRLWRIM